METNQKRQTVTVQAVKVDRQGRALIPKAFRKGLDVEGGGEIIMRLENAQVVLESKQAAVERLQARFAHLGGHVVDELIEERREEAKRETAEIEGNT